MQKLLSQLLPSFSHTLVALDGSKTITENDVANIRITNLAFDSRQVKEGTLFFALPGTHIDGNTFIPQAIENGANAIVYQGELTKETQKLAAKAVIKRQLNNALSDNTSNTPDNSYSGVLPAFIKVSDSRFVMSPVAEIGRASCRERV